MQLVIRTQLCPQKVESDVAFVSIDSRCREKPFHGSLWLEPSTAVQETYPLVTAPSEQPHSWGWERSVIEC